MSGLLTFLGIIATAFILPLGVAVAQDRSVWAVLVEWWRGYVAGFYMLIRRTTRAIGLPSPKPSKRQRAVARAARIRQLERELGIGDEPQPPSPPGMMSVAEGNRGVRMIHQRCPGPVDVTSLAGATRRMCSRATGGYRCKGCPRP